MWGDSLVLDLRDGEEDICLVGDAGKQHRGRYQDNKVGQPAERKLVSSMCSPCDMCRLILTN